MAWLLIALGGHFANAIVFVVDKSLLSAGTKISSPLRYALFSSLVAGAAIVLLPFFFAPITGFIAQWSAVAGAARILALVFFFSALVRGEASRLVPIAGSSVPVFTVIIAASFLDETLTAVQLAAFVLLVAGGALLSISLKKTKALAPSAVAFALAAGVFFASNFAAAKHLYGQTDPFLPVFVYTRVIEALLALVVLGPIVYLRGSLAKRKSPKAQARSKALVSNPVAASAFLTNKALAAGGFLALNWAIDLGSVSVVNALQGTQYVFVLILAAAVSKWAPQFFREELSRVALTQKIAGILAVSGGLVLLFI